MIRRIHAMMRWLAPILIMLSGGCASSETRQPESMIRDAASPPVDMAVMPVDMTVDDDMARMILVCDLDCTGYPSGSNCMLQQLLCAATPDIQMSTD